MLTLNKERLLAFLCERKDKIHGPKFPADGLFAAITYAVALLTTNYDDTNPIAIAFFWMVFVCYFIYLVIKIVKWFKNKYTVEDLYNEILLLEKDMSHYSLLAIKINFQGHSDRFLLQYDKRWKCYLLPYLCSHADLQVDQDNALSFISSNLGINNNSILIKHLGEKTHTKYSISNARTKKYQHRFYEITITSTNKLLTRRTFKACGKRFRWFSIREMQNNKKIIRANRDVVDTLKEFYP